MATRTQAAAVAIETLERGRRFQVAGAGKRRGVLLRLTEVSAIVVYDKRDGERRRPLTISLHTQVIPLEF